MLHAVPVIPTDLTLSGALALALTILAATICTAFLARSFTMLTPARRRDLIELVRAIRGNREKAQ